MEAIKLIRHNASNVNIPDDPTLTWRLDASFRPPEFLSFAFLGLYGGTEELCVRGETQAVLEEFATKNNLYNHPRKRSLKIWQPEEVQP